MYLIQVSYDIEAFISKGGPEEVIKPEHFYARFIEEWKV